MRLRIFSAAVAFVVLAVGVQAGEAVVSTMRNVAAYMDYNGYHIRPIGVTTTPGDFGPTQLFQIVRPSNDPLTIGRLYTSCTCIQLSADKKSYAPGEAVVLTLRNVRHTSGNTYPFYVQLTAPVKATLRYDTYVVSDSQPEPVVSPPVEASTPETPPLEAVEEILEENPPVEIAPEEPEETKPEFVPEPRPEPILEDEKPAPEPAADEAVPERLPELEPIDADAEGNPDEPPLREVNAAAISILEKTMNIGK